MLRDEITYAFSKTPHLGDEKLTECGCDECRWEVRRFRGKRWSRLKPDDINNGDGGNVNFLSPTAFKYFLPGLMLLILDGPEKMGTLPDMIVDRWTASDRDGDEKLQWSNRNIKRLLMRQRQVAAEFLRVLGKTHPHVPVIWLAAVDNLLSGKARPYSQTAVQHWLSETYGWPPDG